MEKGRPLTAKQNMFVAEYLIDLNATQAATRAGYSPKTADKIGPALMGKSSIQTAIQRAMKLQEQRTAITADRVLAELAKVAFGDLRGVMTWDERGVSLRDSKDLTDEQAALISEVSETVSRDGGSVKVKGNDKLKALELIGRHLGMYDKNNRVELVLPADGEDADGRRVARRLILEEVREARQGGDPPDGGGE